MIGLEVAEHKSIDYDCQLKTGKIIFSVQQHTIGWKQFVVMQQDVLKRCFEKNDKSIPSPFSAGSERAISGDGKRAPCRFDRHLPRPP